MRSKEIFRVKYTIVDRGCEIQKDVESYFKADYKSVVKKELRRIYHSMDLSDNYTFRIESVNSVGFGSL